MKLSDDDKAWLRDFNYVFNSNNWRLLISRFGFTEDEAKILAHEIFKDNRSRRKDIYSNKYLDYMDPELESSNSVPFSLVTETVDDTSFVLGDIVKVTLPDHFFSNEIGTIVDISHGIYTIKILSKTGYRKRKTEPVNFCLMRLDVSCLEKISPSLDEIA